MPPLTLAVSASLLAGMALIAGCAGTPGLFPAAQPRGSDAAAPAAAPATAPTPIPAPARSVSVRINESITHQVIEGFGATITAHFDLASGEDLMGALRPRVIEAVFGQVGITMGHLDVGPYENFDPARYTTANDDDDPFTFNWRAFNFVLSDRQKAGIVDLARPYGFDNFTIHTGTNVRWSDRWMAGVRRIDYRLYLEEMAENVVAPLIYWRDKFGIVTRWHHLYNEPTTGNDELAGGGVQEVVDIVKAVGARLRREGFGDVRLVAASEETEEASLASARAILADPEARRYVGAISYHTYPYGSVYSDVNRILATSGQGQPDAGRIRIRNAIRDLAKQYGLQVWMTEVSNGRAGPLDMLRGRAIHIHDEMRYASASSYWAMFQAWDASSQHGACNEDCLVYFNRERGTVSISGTGYAIGHYARWIRRGAVRIDSQTDDPLVLASVFRDDARKKIIAVVINNHREPVSMTLKTAGRVELGGEVKGEQSSAEGYWLPINAEALREDGGIGAILPGRSVTSLSVGFR
jgi:O-glycosyl hydrolase